MAHEVAVEEIAPHLLQGVERLVKGIMAVMVKIAQAQTTVAAVAAQEL